MEWGRGCKFNNDFFFKDRGRRWRKARGENVRLCARASRDWPVEEEGSDSKKMREKVLITGEILRDRHMHCYTHLWQHVWNVQVQTRWTWKWIRRELLAEIWEFGSLPGKRFRGWVKRGSWSHAHHTSRTTPRSPTVSSISNTREINHNFHLMLSYCLTEQEACPNVYRFQTVCGRWKSCQHTMSQPPLTRRVS